MDGVMEVITGRERRRRWSTLHKLRIVAETREPGVRIGDVAARQFDKAIASRRDRLRRAAARTNRR